MSFPPYPDYKDSGINWLGPAPAHWNVKRLRHVASLNPGKSQIRRLPPETEVTFLPMEAVGDDGSLDRRHTKPLGEVIEGYTYLGERDVAFAKITPCFENGKAALATHLKNELAFATTELTVLRPDTRLVSARYLYRIITSRPFRELGEASMYGAGGQKRVPDNFARDFAIPLPPPDEQRQIADFLDHETARIDALIDEQQRLISLLQEKQQEVIGEAVSRGLDRDVTTKDSGVAEIGTIPSHWELKRLWHMTPRHRQIMYGIVLPGPHYEGGVPIVKGGDVAEHRLKLNSLSRTDPEIERKYERSRLRAGDLVYSIRGSIGEVAKIPADLDGTNLTQDAARIAYTESTDGDWLLYALQANPIFRQLESKAVGATIRGINIRDLKRAVIPTPPLHEQREIAEFLKEQVAEFQRLKDEAKRAISLMTEHRASLISSAVTGKIDVREWEHSTPSTEEALPQAAEKEGRYG